MKTFTDLNFCKTEIMFLGLNKYFLKYAGLFNCVIAQSLIVTNSRLVNGQP